MTIQREATRELKLTVKTDTTIVVVASKKEGDIRIAVLFHSGSQHVTIDYRLLKEVMAGLTEVDSWAL